MGKGRKRAAAAAACAMALVAVAAGVVAWQPWAAPSDGGGDGSAPAGQPAAAPAVLAPESPGNGWTSDPALLLSSWGGFGEFWEECAEGDGGCSYSELPEAGAASFYRLRDGLGPGMGPERSLALADAQRVPEGVGGAWDLAAVDCTTGEVTYWSMGPALERAIAGEGPAACLVAEGCVVPYGGAWAAYVNTPLPAPDPGDSIGTDSVRPPVEVFTVEDSRWCELVMFETMDDGAKRECIAAAEGDERLMAMLVERYGREEIGTYREAD